ncbi:HipA N-terminal domain-containing protein [Brevundimonas sp.]|uniref:HipA N-terminal domain-containing protein n=1 Tax=Brevundimonas sp. TaxID=1871086 RepID=UPI0028983DBD|nr:HipA N-terminal domain-containing protein [Brevundimonas sp.]
MADEVLDVWMDGFARPTGRLARTSHGDTAFLYDADYANAGGPSLLLSLPVETEAFGDVETRAFFANLLPENAQLQRVMEREGLARDDVVGLLKHLGADCAGSVSCVPRGAAPIKSPGVLAEDYEPLEDRANQVEMAILNLAVNARDAMPDGGRLTISAAAERIGEAQPGPLAPGRYVRLCVADTGVGMDDETLKRAVEPFFSTKGIGKGTGLGLSMVHGLAAQSGGALVVSSTPGLGTKVELWLPTTETVADAPEPVEPLQGPARSGTALVVDDEDLVRSSTAEMLADLGYAVVEAHSAEEAWRLLEGGLVPDLLVTDHLMPGLSGADLVRQVAATRPVQALIISAYADVEGIAPDLPRLVKPFRQIELAQAIAALTVIPNGLSVAAEP